LAAKSNKMGAISHGFEFSRTLSCAKATKRNSHKEAQKAHNVYSGRGALCFLPILWARLLIIIFVLFVLFCGDLFCGFCGNRDAQCSDVAARVKGSQRDGVFARSKGAEVDGVDLVTTVGDPVVGKDGDP